MRCLVIIPTYNERENLPTLVGAILAAQPAMHVLVVDDASPDGTGRLADQLAEGDPRLTVLHRAAKQGLGRAYVAGFDYALKAGYDYVLQMDADLSHDPADLGRLLSAAEEAPVVIGSRWVAGGGLVGWSRLRRLVSRSGRRYARLMLGVPVEDVTSGFKCFRLAALKSLELDHLRANGYAFQVEVNYACACAGFPIVEVPIVFRNRRWGKSKMTLSIAFEAAWIVLLLRLGIRPPAIALPRPASTAKAAP